MGHGSGNVANRFFGLSRRKCRGLDIVRFQSGRGGSGKRLSARERRLRFPTTSQTHSRFLKTRCTDARSDCARLSHDCLFKQPFNAMEPPFTQGRLWSRTVHSLHRTNGRTVQKVPEHALSCSFARKAQTQQGPDFSACSLRRRRGFRAGSAQSRARMGCRAPSAAWPQSMTHRRAER